MTSTARLGIYLVGLVLIVAAFWVFLTQTDIGNAVPAGVALALILLIVGIGVMASAKTVTGGFERRRVVHEPVGGHVERDHTHGDVTYEERRFD